MATGEHSHEPHHNPDLDFHISPVVVLLERLDNFFHVIVGVLFILMAATVLIHTCIVFARQVPLLVPQRVATTPKAEAMPVPSGEAKPAETTALPSATRTESHLPAGGGDPFLLNSLEILSSILFVVIILELLRTILTYLQTHNIQAIMQEFIVVGIISSVRKILLVGAESSLTGSAGMEFIQESIGTLLSIGGILALILGLVMLQRGFGSKKESA